MPNLLQIANLFADLIIIYFVGYYLLKFTKKERQLEEKEKKLEEKQGKVDTVYHQVVDNALSKERKILGDATDEAETIINKTQFVSQESREVVNKALEEMVTGIRKEADDIGRQFIVDYKNYLAKLSETSLGNFENIAKEFGADLEKQIKDFRKTLLPALEKELEDYKQERIKTADKAINVIVQKVSQKALNKSIPIEDHNDLVMESLEKAKKEGIFD
jgi:hypothetical protein